MLATRTLGPGVTAIERTAYPRLKRRPSTQELADVYTPTVEDLAFIRTTARGPSPTLTLAVLLKVFQRLGHFPRLQDVPFAIVTHVRSSLRLPSDTALDVTPRTLYRHHEQIRTHLQVKGWGAEARHATIVAVHRAAQVMNHPADLINVAIEELVRQRFELPCTWHARRAGQALSEPWSIASSFSTPCSCSWLRNSDGSWTSPTGE